MTYNLSDKQIQDWKALTSLNKLIHYVPFSKVSVASVADLEKSGNVWNVLSKLFILISQYDALNTHIIWSHIIYQYYNILKKGFLIAYVISNSKESSIIGSDLK